MRSVSISAYMEDEKSMFERLLRQLVDAFRNYGATESQVQMVEAGLRQKMADEPSPRIALIGFTGVGKSSTINALFNAGQEISDVRACTKEAHEIRANVSEYSGSQGTIVVYDMPGLGEDLRADKKHLETYASFLPRVDVAVWTFHAGDRAMTPMQQALLTLQDRIGHEFTKKLIFAVNKADTIAPGETAWIRQANVPSHEQQKNIAEFENYIREKVRQVWPEWDGRIVTYSARQKYRLESLMTAMVDAVGAQRRWVLEQRADVADYLEEIDPSMVEFVRHQGANLGDRGSRPWRRGK